MFFKEWGFLGKGFLLLTACFLLVSCGGALPSGGGDLAGQSLSESLETNVSKASLDPKMENYITFDVLGGIFRKSMDIEAMVLDEAIETTSKSAAKLSISVPPPPSGGGKPFVIDTAYSYVGKNGSGKLVISASGSGTDEFTTADLSQKIRHFNPLKLRFLFFNFVFNNKCLGEVHVDGEIVCDITGQYDTAARKFLGNAHCANGSTEQPQTILYITEAANYDVEMNADLIINGNPFNYGSYKNTGIITIDGAEKKIEELIVEGSSCS